MYIRGKLASIFIRPSCFLPFHRLPKAAHGRPRKFPSRHWARCCAEDLNATFLLVVPRSQTDFMENFPVVFTIQSKLSHNRQAVSKPAVHSSVLTLSRFVSRSQRLHKSRSFIGRVFVSSIRSQIRCHGGLASIVGHSVSLAFAAARECLVASRPSGARAHSGKEPKQWERRTGKIPVCSRSGGSGAFGWTWEGTYSSMHIRRCRTVARQGCIFVSRSPQLCDFWYEVLSSSAYWQQLYRLCIDLVRTMFGFDFACFVHRWLRLLLVEHEKVHTCLSLHEQMLYPAKGVFLFVCV